jgi:HEAT repeat protein
VVLAGLLLSATGCATQASKQPADETRPATQSPAAKSQGDLKAKVEALLSGYERIPTDEDWKRLGPDALGVLEQLYNDPAQLPSTRTRAVASMAQVDNPAAVDSLKAIVADAKVDAQYRSTAVLALGYRTGEQALPQLEPLLDDKSPQMRDAAARAIGKVGTPDARKSLEERLGKEQDPAVREAIQQSLTKMEP